MRAERRTISGRGFCLGLVLVATGCGLENPATMVHLEPPPDWATGLTEERRSKDLLFRSSPESPVATPLREAFQGLDYWEPDAAYYFVGDIHWHEQPERFRIITTNGEERPCERIGWVEFRLDATSQRLQVYRLLDLDGAQGLFLPFADGTTGLETYGAGRYVDLEGPPGGPYVLDFNRAYNPSCAYGAPERFACPITPPENRLTVRLAAGERGYLALAQDGA